MATWLVNSSNKDADFNDFAAAGRRRKESARWARFAAVVVLPLLSGCSATKPPAIQLAWPPPPDKARITFVGIIHDEFDLGRTTADLVKESVVGKKTPESFEQPMGAAVSRDGKRLYVTDFAKPGVFVIDFEARSMTPFGWGPGVRQTGHSVSAESLAAELQGFTSPLGIALDDRENVYVVDSLPKRIHVFGRNGNFLRTITHTNLEHPIGIAVDSARNRIYVVNSGTKASPNHTLQVFDLDGNQLMAFGGTGAAEGKLFFPSYVALDAQGNAYVTDTMNGRVQEFASDGRFLKTFGQRGDAYGQFEKPKGVALDTFGNVYVVDSGWSNVQIFNQHAEVLLFFAQRGGIPGLLVNPTAIAIDHQNRIYVADAFNKRIAIYQLVNTTAVETMGSRPN